MMNAIKYILSVIITFFLIIAAIITSVEAVVYREGFFIKEYKKLNISQNVGISLNDLMYVTNEMMDYLIDERPDLDNIVVNVDGEDREFFNEKEKSHMDDVKVLFLKAIIIRRIVLILAIVLLAILIFLKKWVKIFSRAAIFTVCGFLGLLAVLGTVISTDFTKYFCVFHEIFFTNDLWVLDPSTDLLINIVPEKFFIDTAVNIGVTFAAFCIIIVLVCASLMKLIRKDNT